MKTLIKITTLAVIAAFALFSCAPEAELSGVNWKEVHAKNNSGKNSGYATDMNTLLNEFSVPGSLSLNANSDPEFNELNITFPESSDFLKAGANVETEMRKFLSFHHFTKAAAANSWEADSLGSALAYNYVKRNGSTITIKLTKTFVNTESNVILKIDGTKYTFANGNKIDKAGRGKSGEAGYDDFYKEIEFSGATTGPKSFSEPGNKGWSLTLGSIYATQSPANNATFSAAIASLDTSGADVARATTVAEQIIGGLKIQNFINGSWRDVSVEINYAAGSFAPRTPLTLEDLVPHRVIWVGSAPVITEDEYFGVKQYIKIIGHNTPNSTWNPTYYRMGRVYGPVTDVWYKNNNTHRFSAPAPGNATIYSMDSLTGKNVVIDVIFYVHNAIFLKDYTADKQKFKDNFKIVYSSGGNAVNFSTSDLVYIPIKDFEFLRKPITNSGLNLIRITLDPNYKSNTNTKYLRISPEIGYTDNETTFGSAAYPNFMHGCLEFYSIGNGF